MKTTMMFRPIANPRRTTLAHLSEATAATGASGPAGVDESAGTAEDRAGDGREAPTGSRPLPQRTANPRRTVLTELPKAPVTP
ncbi:hypothetical protein ACFO3J_04225 [Streptomyces polygonati]|uniref:Uncharacterized protein n=1 Tax=Streptomyces polygonati TaxID=1617087 RepID=A0ABV8HHZ7_9ACTN